MVSVTGNAAIAPFVPSAAAITRSIRSVVERMLAERESSTYRPTAVAILDEDEDIGALPLEDGDDEDDPIIGGD